jgi:hypothetical protein
VVITLSIQRLLEEWDVDPFTSSVWDGLDAPLTRDEVAEAIRRGSSALRVGRTPSENRIMFTRTFHIRRVAWLAVHGWTDPISVDVGIPCMNYTPDWPVLDGNHRFAAALFRGDEAILADCAGQEDWIETFEVGCNPPVPA